MTLPTTGSLNLTDLATELTTEGSNPWSGWEPRVSFKPILLDTMALKTTVYSVSPSAPNLTEISTTPLRSNDYPMRLIAVDDSGGFYYIDSVLTNSGYILKCNAAGDILWRTSIPNAAYDIVVDTPARIAVVLGNLRLFGINITTGEVVWSVNHPLTRGVHDIHASLALLPNLGTVVVVNGGEFDAWSPDEDKYDATARRVSDGSYIASVRSVRTRPGIPAYDRKTIYGIKPTSVLANNGFTAAANLVDANRSTGALFEAPGNDRSSSASIELKFDVPAIPDGFVIVGITVLGYGSWSYWHDPNKITTLNLETTILTGDGSKVLNADPLSSEIKSGSLSITKLSGAANLPSGLSTGGLIPEGVTTQELVANGLRARFDVNFNDVMNLDGNADRPDAASYSLDYLELSVHYMPVETTMDIQPLSVVSTDGGNLYVSSSTGMNTSEPKHNLLEKWDPNTLQPIQTLSVPTDRTIMKMAVIDSNRIVLESTVGSNTIKSITDDVRLDIYNVTTNTLVRSIVPPIPSGTTTSSWLEATASTILYRTLTNIYVYDVNTGQLRWQQGETPDDSGTEHNALHSPMYGLITTGIENRYDGVLSSKYNYVGVIDPDYDGTYRGGLPNIPTELLPVVQTTKDLMDPNAILSVSRSLKAGAETAGRNGSFLWVVRRDNSTGAIKNITMANSTSPFAKNPTLDLDIDNGSAHLSAIWKYTYSHPALHRVAGIGILHPVETGNQDDLDFGADKRATLVKIPSTGNGSNMNHYEFLRTHAKQGNTVTLELQKPEVGGQPQMSLSLYRSYLNKTDPQAPVSLSEFYGLSGRFSYTHTLTQTEYNQKYAANGGIGVDEVLKSGLGVSTLPVGDYTLINQAWIYGASSLSDGSIFPGRNNCIVTGTLPEGSTLTIINDGRLYAGGGRGGGRILYNIATGDPIVSLTGYPGGDVIVLQMPVKLRLGTHYRSGGGAGASAASMTKTGGSVKSGGQYSYTHWAVAGGAGGAGGKGGDAGSNLNMTTGKEVFGGTPPSSPLGPSFSRTPTKGSATTGGLNGTMTVKGYTYGGGGNAAGGASGPSGTQWKLSPTFERTGSTYVSGGAAGVVIRNNGHAVTYI